MPTFFSFSVQPGNCWSSIVSVFNSTHPLPAAIDSNLAVAPAFSPQFFSAAVFSLSHLSHWKDHAGDVTFQTPRIHEFRKRMEHLKSMNWNIKQTCHKMNDDLALAIPWFMLAVTYWIHSCVVSMIHVMSLTSLLAEAVASPKLAQWCRKSSWPGYFQKVSKAMIITGHVTGHGKRFKDTGHNQSTIHTTLLG